MKKIILTLLAALVVFGALYSVARRAPSATSSAAFTAGSDAPGSAGALPPGGIETGTLPEGETLATTTESDVSVRAFNYGFSPSSITVKKGDRVKVELTDAGGLHDFVVDELGVRSPRLETGATTTVEFDATQAGVFQYYCSVGNHRALGMWGTLTVLP